MKKTAVVSINNKKLNNWLKLLTRALNRLAPVDRNDIIDNYRENLQEQLGAGMTAEEILLRMEPINTIATNIYAELLSEDKPPKKNIMTKLFGGVVSTIGCVWIWFLAIAPLIAFVVFLVLGFAFLLLPIYGFLAFGAYDVGPAFGLWFLLAGLTPIIFLIFYCGAAIAWVILRIFIVQSIKVFQPDSRLAQRLATFSFFTMLNRISKKSRAILVTVFGVCLIGGALGSFLGNQTVLGAQIQHNYLHTQKEIYNGDLTDVQCIDTRDLGSDEGAQIILRHYTGFVNQQSHNEVTVVRHYNHRAANLAQIKWSKTSQGILKVQSSIPWMDQAFNINFGTRAAQYIIFVPQNIKI